MGKMQIGEVISLISKYPRFKPYVDRMRAARICRKPFFFPKPSLSMTLFNTIFYSRDFFESPMASQCAIMLHETEHLFQIDRTNMFKSALNYINKEGRLRVEKEAYAMNLKWYATIGKIPNPNKSSNPIAFLKKNPHAISAATHLLEHYGVGDTIDEDELWRWIHDIVRAQFVG